MSKVVVRILFVVQFGKVRDCVFDAFNSKFEYLVRPKWECSCIIAHFNIKFLVYSLNLKFTHCNACLKERCLFSAVRDKHILKVQI